MRLLKDLRDWFALRRHIVRPWQFLRQRRTVCVGGGAWDVRLKDGASVRVRANGTDAHILLYVFGRDEYRLGEFAPGSLDTVVDIGAHVGIFAIRAAPLARAVFCYEPFPESYALLTENTRRWPHVRAQRLAVSDSRGTEPLYLCPTDPGQHSLIRGVADPTPTATMMVETTTLSDVFREKKVERCSLLKLDCEGAEYRILSALRPEDWRRIERIAMEYHPIPGEDASRGAVALSSLLTDMGFEVSVYPRRLHPERGMLFAAREDGGSGLARGKS